jgi:hypothetical protein
MKDLSNSENIIKLKDVYKEEKKIARRTESIFYIVMELGYNDLENDIRER